MTNLHLVLAGVGLGVAWFAAVFTLLQSGQKPLSRILLAALLFCCGINVVHPFLPDFFGHSAFLGGVRVNEPMQFVTMPLLFLYVRSVFKPERALRVRASLHALPALAVVGLTLVSLAQAIESFSAVPLFTVGGWSALLIQAIAYFIPSLRMVHAYERNAKNQVSNLKGIDLGWVHWFFVIFLLLYASYAVLLALMIHSPVFPPVRAYLSTAITLAVCILAFRALLQKEIETQSEIPRTVLPETQAHTLKNKLLEVMENRHLYTNPELSLSELALAVGAPRNHVSYVINEHFGQNFYDFVNRMRVEEVIRLMANPEKRNLKILGLAFDAGFNSKQTFNLVFKKMTGKTPSEYRKADTGSGVS